MSDARIRIVGEDAAAAVIAGVDRSIGELTADVLLATKHVADLKKELAEEVQKGRQGQIAGISAQLDEAIPRMQAAEAELKAKLKPALEDVDQSSTKWSGRLVKMNDLLGLFGLGLSVNAVIGFGQAILDDADQLTKMAAKTDLSLQALQRFRVVGDDVGNSVNEMTSAISSMQNRIAGGDDSAEAAIRQMGYSVDEFKALGPEQQFYAVSDAVRAIKDPADQAAFAVDVFGASGKQILPALKAGFDDVRDAAVGMSDDAIEAIDDLGDTWSSFSRGAKGVAAEMIVEFGRFAAAGFSPFQKQFDDQVRLMQQLQEQAQKMSDAAVRPKIFAPPPDEFTLSESALKSFNREMEEGAKRADQLADAQKKAAEEAKTLRDRWAAVEESAQGVDAILATLNGEVEQGIRYYVRQGVALRDVADLYGLTAAQTNALSTRLKAEADEWKKTEQAVRNYMAARGNATPLLDVLPDSGRQLPKLPTITSTPLGNQFLANFGETLQTQLPQSIMAAILGGGSVWQAAGATVGSFLVSEDGIGKTIQSGLSSTLGKGLGGAVNSIMPMVGTLMGPLLGKLGSLLSGALGGPSEAELKGRDAARAFEQSITSALTAAQRAEAGNDRWRQTVVGVRDAYLAAGHSAAEAEAAVERLWAAERQGPEAVAAVQAEITAIMQAGSRARQGASQFGPSRAELQQMAADTKATYDYMLSSGQYTAEQLEAAFKASQEAQAKALGINIDAQKKAFESLQDGLNDLQSQRDQLWQQVAQEAPEEVMGVIETQTRGQIAALDASIAAQRIKLEEEAAAAAQALETSLAAVEPEPVHVPIIFDVPPLPGGGESPETIPSLANEGYDLASPMIARIGDAPGDTESVLHARTVRDIVRAARNAGAATLNTRALEARVDALATTMKRMTDAIQLQTTLMPMAIRDALSS